MYKAPSCNGRRGRKGRPSSWWWIQVECLGSFRRDGVSDAPIPLLGMSNWGLGGEGRGMCRASPAETNWNWELAKRGSRTQQWEGEGERRLGEIDRFKMSSFPNGPREGGEHEQTRTHTEQRLAAATEEGKAAGQVVFAGGGVDFLVKTALSQWVSCLSWRNGAWYGS